MRVTARDSKPHRPTKAKLAVLTALFALVATAQALAPASAAAEMNTGTGSCVLLFIPGMGFGYYDEAGNTCEASGGGGDEKIEGEEVIPVEGTAPPEEPSAPEPCQGISCPQGDDPEDDSDADHPKGGWAKRNGKDKKRRGSQRECVKLEDTAEVWAADGGLKSRRAEIRRARAQIDRFDDKLRDGKVPDSDEYNEVISLQQKITALRRENKVVQEARKDWVNLDCADVLYGDDAIDDSATGSDGN